MAPSLYIRDVLYRTAQSERKEEKISHTARIEPGTYTIAQSHQATHPVSPAGSIPSYANNFPFLSSYILGSVPKSIP